MISRPLQVGTVFVLVLLTLGSNEIAAQNVGALIVDLAEFDEDETKVIPVEPGSYVIRAINLVPSGDYQIQVARVIREIRPVPAPDPGRQTAPVAANVKAAACDGLRTATALLRAAREEKSVPPLREAVDQHLRGVCDEDGARDTARMAVRATTRATTHPVSLERGVDLRVTITRLDTGRTFTTVFETGDRGQWRTGYGFTFVVDPWNARYYSQSTGKPDSFVVAREARRRWMDFVPTLFYTWMPAEDLLEDWSTGVTLGLGFDSSRPVVLFGGQRTYNQNLSISVGFALHPQQVLSGRYREGSVLKENLGPEQLHEDRYRISPYLSLSLRSLTNPFARADSTDGDPPQP